MPSSPIKVKLPTPKQVKKEASTSRSKRRAEENKKLNKVQKEEHMKVTHYSKDSEHPDVVMVPLSPSKNRSICLPVPSSSSAAQDDDNPIHDDITMDLHEQLSNSNSDQIRKKVRFQGISQIMAALRTRMPQIQRAYINQQYDSRITQACTCSSGQPRLFRCKDCWVWGVRCSQCMILRHQGAPFHAIEHWNGSFFEPASLADIGVRVYLGHGGDPCPNSHQSFKRLTILHTTGITEISVNFCFCSHHPSDFEQLLDLRLFPATADRVETVISFELLDDFHLHTLTSKKAAFDYYDSLQRKTSPVLPHKAKNYYHIFLRVVRIHRHLAAKRRAGQSHGIDQHVPHRPEKRTGVYCPACPEPGFNIKVEDIMNTPDDQRHKNTMYVAVDGCHSAQRLNKRDDPDDVALNEGSGYFSARHGFRQYIKDNTGDKDPLTCSRLKAARMQNILKFKNAVITGIVGTICTRHGLFLPNGMVDMPKGEMYCLGDWALYHGLLGREDLKDVHISYDLWCLFKVRLPDRFKRWPIHFSNPKLVELITTARGCIPQLHIESHGHACKACYHFDYTRNVGRTNGELVETPWSSEKLTGGSTRHMNDGHRHDTLDDFHGFWNFCKVQKLGRSLMRQWAQAQLAFDELQPAFNEFSKIFGDELLNEWEKLYAKPLPDKRDKDLVDLYMARVGEDIPSFQNRIDAQLSAENLRVMNQSGIDGVTLLIAEGISLDMIRCKLLHFESQKDVSKARKQQLANARQKYGRQVATFTESLCSFFPLVVPVVEKQKQSSDGVLDSQAELSPLILPSYFDSDRRIICHLQQAAEIERDLREGQANDLLEEVRCRILTRNHIAVVKKVEATGQQHHTRSLGLMKTQTNGAKTAMRLYNHNREAMLSLGPESMDSQYQKLEANQLWVTNHRRQRNLGEPRSDPWYWNVSFRSKTDDEDDNAWLTEMNRVKWFRDRALLDRYKEELEILEAEYTRSCVFHEKMTEIWTALAKESQSDGEFGYTAYAQKQAAVYQMLREDITEHWEKRKGLMKDLISRKTKRTSQQRAEKAKDSGDGGLDVGAGPVIPEGDIDDSTLDDDEDEEGWQDLGKYAQGSVEDDDDEMVDGL
ncbi:hypothetical protein VNI00_015120 [Paramarasmius palmivorus]|uniref:CxC2-like cysteine cluster KDZ transposase-associated domain-containing protein n=1 Tax=Paramarasmius palmivorus TaxID=297713 RepID=A0AAW0BNA8_9AGAR